jgi:hypothetical protein
MLILQATFVGCQTPGKSAIVPHVDPVLSNTLSCEQLVDYLNSQNEGLHGWQCMQTQVHVSMPGIPLPQKLTGALSCSAPSSFRLTADNFVAMADVGSNKELCWSYFKPGEPVVMTWHHEDAHLLEFVPGSFPRLDPEWLMVILGIQPLDARDFQIQKPPAGSRDLWLVSIEESASGQTLRRVIKVDTVRGFAREHSLVDHNGDHLLRAQLSNHRKCGGHVIPHTVKISFPPQKTELTLSFRGIEPNCQIKDELWTPPGGDRLTQIDLGEYVRSLHADIPPRQEPVVDSIAENPRSDTMLDGTPRHRRDGFQDPDFEPLDKSDESLFPDNQSPDGRFFGNEDPDDADQSLDEDANGLRSSPRGPIREAAFEEEPDFDIVAPKKRRSLSPWIRGQR